MEKKDGEHEEMNIKPHVCKNSTDPIFTRNYDDEMLLYLSEPFYNEQWQKRCDDCLAPCCIFPMSGYVYDYRDDDFIKNVGDASAFWTNDFVIMNIKNQSWKDNREMGFNIIYNPIELSNEGLQICPLNVLGKCLIYKDRPLMCKNWKCNMKVAKIYK